MTRKNYTQYVHEYIDDNLRKRYAVGQWDQERAQYTAPLDTTTARLTGCSARFARRPQGMETYSDRTRALRRARYLFGDN
jgi:hypothetical protein